MRGSDVKLCRGGGQLVAHSSEPPHPHGSSTVTFGAFFMVVKTFQMKNRVEMPRIAAPTVETMFNVVKPSTGGAVGPHPAPPWDPTLIVTL